MNMTSDGSSKPMTISPERRSLRSILRPAPSLTPEDSLGRAMMLMRHMASDRLPALRYGNLVGEIHEADISDLVSGQPYADCERILRRPVSEIVRESTVALRPAMSQEEARRLCAPKDTTLLRCVPVVDADNYCLGVVHLHDLLTDDSPVPRPNSIGGMATPFGVYLTDGAIQAGAGNFALLASGAAMGMTIVMAELIVNGGLSFAQRYLHLPNFAMIDLTGSAASHDLASGIVSVGTQLILYLVFFTFMRSTILAGYHAAEHQTVHAIERSEPLVPEVVSRMPRAHPRCGTNLMAAVTLFLLLQQLFKVIPGLNEQPLEIPEILAGLTTLFTWRSVGTFLQERFTTRSASQRQIQSGIAAGTELMSKYINSPPLRPRLWRRIWCMGMLQSLGGMLLIVVPANHLIDLWNATHH